MRKVHFLLPGYLELGHWSFPSLWTQTVTLALLRSWVHCFQTRAAPSSLLGLSLNDCMSWYFSASIVCKPIPYNKYLDRSLPYSLLEGPLESEVSNINMEQRTLPIVLGVNYGVLTMTLSPLWFSPWPLTTTPEQAHALVVVNIWSSPCMHFCTRLPCSHGPLCSGKPNFH